jgi:membrane protease YdiL (CAAX protease family)
LDISAGGKHVRQEKMISALSTPAKNRCVVVLIFVLLSIVPFTSVRSWVLPAFSLTVLLAIAAGAPQTLHLAVFVFLTALSPRLFSSYPSLLVAKAMPVLLYAVVVALVPSLRRSLGWLRPGRMDGKSVLTVLLVLAVSALALFIWERSSSPNMTGYARLVPEMPAGYLPIYVAVFALVNALAEELLWRGAMLAALDIALGAGGLALALQALQFGIAHYRGPFLYGWAGVALSGIFGWVLGRIRRRTDGLLACWLAHAAADFTILLLIIFFTRRSLTG